MPTILQITFKRPEQPPDEESRKAIMSRANKIASVPGLIWKIWIANETTLGGTYLFQDEASARSYLDSPIPDDIRGMPEFTTEIFRVEEEFSAITHAPMVSTPFKEED